MARHRRQGKRRPVHARAILNRLIYKLLFEPFHIFKYGAAHRTYKTCDSPEIGSVLVNCNHFLFERHIM